jgi:hypothetical protein
MKSDVVKKVTFQKQALPTQKKSLIKFKPDPSIANASSFEVYDGYSCKLKSRGEEEKRIYIIQILKKNNFYYVYSHWGKQGMIGQKRMSFPIDNAKDAVIVFEKRFKEKTNVDWNKRDNHKDYNGDYEINHDESMELLDNDQFNRAEGILKDILFEIIVDSKVNNKIDKELIKRLRNELTNEFPNIFEKIVFTSLDSVKEAFLLLKKSSNKL